MWGPYSDVSVKSKAEQPGPGGGWLGMGDTAAGIISSPVLIATSGGALSSGELRIQTWNKRERLVRAAKFFFLFLGLAIVAVFMPFAHFFLVPGFLVAALFGFFYRLGQDSAILGGSGTCPHCQAALPLVGGRVQFPLRDLCTSCQNPVTIEPADADRIALLIEGAFAEFWKVFCEMTAGAKVRFETRDWQGGHADTVGRLDLRATWVAETTRKVRAALGPHAQDRSLWVSIKKAYQETVADRHDIELAESFYNSVTRKIFETIGIHPEIEFIATEFKFPDPESPGVREICLDYAWNGTSRDLIARILEDYPFAVPYADLETEINLAAARIDEHFGPPGSPRRKSIVTLVHTTFFRGHAAYLVGRVGGCALFQPFILALVNEPDGIHLDAMIFDLEDTSILFSFTRSYFQVATERTAELISFLKTILPAKRTSELYISVGYNRHGKTELYREIQDHLTKTREKFTPARGTPGLVMAAFTPPSLNLIFKVIRDRFPPSKNITREEVKQKYQLVFRQDRAGRMIDAQEFENLTFRKDDFSPEVLQELLTQCADTVRVEGDAIHLSHLYIERRVLPLDVFLKIHDDQEGQDAADDYGRALRDLAVTNTFPGDLLLKNFGVTRQARVIFYDYDEVALVTECNFRELPTTSDDTDEMRSEPWYYVGEKDVFPEEFLRFLGFSDAQREIFLKNHAEILTAAFWRGMQQRIRAGEVIDIAPYRDSLRLKSRA